MKNKILLLKRSFSIIVLLIITINCSAQNVLDGVYIKGSTRDTVINGDTLKSFINGVVVDDISGKPVADVIMEFYTSNQHIAIKTNSDGKFSFNDVYVDNVNIKVCVGITYGYLTEKENCWKVNTIGKLLPIQLTHEFRLHRSPQHKEE
ncbi:MAG: carboxypeptidase-like regulatory domain-containing protein [Bacteroidota bacterium]